MQDRTVGEVGDIEIPRAELVNLFQRHLENYRRQTGITEVSPGAQEQLMNRAQSEILSSYLFLAAVKKKGIHAPDAAVAAEIRESPEFADDNGDFSFELYRDYVVDERAYQQQVRDFLGREPLLMAATGLPIESVEGRLAALRREERVVDEAFVPAASLTAVVSLTVNITQDEIGAYYQENIADYAIAEEAAFEYFVVSLDSYAATTQVEEEEVAAAYEDFIADWQTRARFRVAHIFVESETEADEIYNLASAQPNSFASLAKERSQDAGSAAFGGELGIFADGDLPEELNAAVVSLQTGDIHPPVASGDGFSILKLAERIVEAAPSLAESREAMRLQARRDKAAEAFEAKIEELSEQAPLEIGSLAGMAQAAGAAALTITGVRPRATEENPPPFNEEAALLEVFDEQIVSARENSQPIPLESDAYLFARALSHRPANVRPFDSVAEEIGGRLQAQQLANALYDQLAGENLDEEEGPTRRFLSQVEWLRTLTVVLAESGDDDEEDISDSADESAADDDASDELDDQTLDRLYTTDLQFGLPAYAFDADAGGVRVFRIGAVRARPPLPQDQEAVRDLIADMSFQLSYLGYLDELGGNYDFQFYNLPELVPGRPQQN